jgi:hypothetical protein
MWGIVCANIQHILHDAAQVHDRQHLVFSVKKMRKRIGASQAETNHHDHPLI